MNKANLTVAEVGMFAITRVALGVGVGLPDFAPAQQRCVKGSGSGTCRRRWRHDDPICCRRNRTEESERARDEGRCLT